MEEHNDIITIKEIDEPFCVKRISIINMIKNVELNFTIIYVIFNIKSHKLSVCDRVVLRKEGVDNYETTVKKSEAVKKLCSSNVCGKDCIFLNK